MPAGPIHWLGLHWLDWAVLLAYFVGILAIGVWSYRKVHNLSDFFMGGRRFGKVFMMFFAFGSGTSSEQAISVVAGTWRQGLAGIWWQFLWLWATPFYWIVAPVMRRMRALTTADFFEHRFNTSTATLYSLYGMIMSIVFIAGGLYSSGKMINALTGGELDRIAARVDLHVPRVHWTPETGLATGTRLLEGYEFAILAMTALFVTYGMAGGLGAAIITDFIQGLLTITFSFLLLPFVFHMIGGFGALQEQAGLKPGMLSLVADEQFAALIGSEPITVFYVVMLSLTGLAGIVVQPHIMGVCGAGKTEFEGRFGFTFGNFMKRFCTIAWTFTGLACIAWYLGDSSPLKDSARLVDRETYAALKTAASPRFAALPPEEKQRIAAVEHEFADRLFGRAAYEILPRIAPGLVGLLLASLLAAVMSTADAQMVISSGLFTENIYRRFLVRGASQRHYLWVGRLAGLAVVALALVLQSTFTDVIDALKVIIKTPAFIGISLWFGIMWRRWNSWAVWVSTIAGALTWMAVANYPRTIYAWGVLPQSMFKMVRDGEAVVAVSMLDAWQMFWFITVGVTSGIAVSLLTPRQPREKLDPFFMLLHTPVTPGEHVEHPCTLPAGAPPPIPKLFSLPDVEIPRPTLVGVGGFLAAWALVWAIIALTYWLARSL